MVRVLRVAAIGCSFAFLVIYFLRDVMASFEHSAQHRYIRACLYSYVKQRCNHNWLFVFNDEVAVKPCNQSLIRVYFLYLSLQ